MSKLKKANAFISNDIEEMDICAAVEHTDENEDLPALTGNETSQELLDYMVLVISRQLHVRTAFKGGYMLNQLLGEQSRMTHDIDFSISDEDGYLQIVQFLKQIAEQFQNAGIISDYKIKDTITPTNSGGIDFYDNTGKKILGIDIGLHNLSYGLTSYNITIGRINAFTVERMLADKIIAILSRKRFRRTKDIYDLFVLSENFNINIQKLAEFIKYRGNAEWEHIPFSDEIIVQYSKAWDKLVLRTPTDQQLSKPAFNDVLDRFYYIAFAVRNGESGFWSCQEKRLVQDLE